MTARISASARMRVAPSITVLVPALDEEGNLGPTIERLIRALDITVEDYEIIIINDGSSDGTGAEADTLASQYDMVKVIHHDTCRGLGASYAEGVRAGTKHYFTYIPGDNTWPYRSFVQLLSNLGKADAITSYSINPEVRPACRRIVSRLYTIVLNRLFGQRMRYYNGLTIYPKSYLLLEPISTQGFGFQAEALLKAISLGLSYVEVGLPIDERTAGKSKAVNLRNIASVMALMGRLFWELRFGREWGPNSERSRSIEPFAPGVLLARHEIDEIGLLPPIGWDNKTDEWRSAPAERLNIVITGASSGIGASLAEGLAADGHSLFLCARREHELSKIAGDGKARFAVCDVADEAAVERFIDEVGKALGHVDVLINCAATLGPVGSIGQVKPGDWLDTIKTNLWGTFLVTQKCLPLMKGAERPHIINFSGGGAFGPFPNYSAYAASKSGIVRLTETLALELAPDGIMVNAVAPGMVASTIHQPTMHGGASRAGRRHFQKTKAVLEEGGAPVQNVVDCIRALLSPEYYGLTGKAISVNFDPWRTDLFRELIPEICRSDLFCQRRVNIWNMPEGRLRQILERSWSKIDTQL